MFPLYKPDLIALCNSISSVLNQKCDDFEFEYIIVDDSGPGFDSNPILEMLNSLGFTYHYHKNHENLGLANCWNRCVELSNYDYIHYVHQDDYVYHGYYNEIVQLMNVFQCGLYTTRSFYVNEDNLIFGISPLIGTSHFSSLTSSDLLYRTPFQCSATVFSKTAFNAVGGFDDKFKYLLDRHLCYRIIKRFDGVLSNKPFTNYRFSSSSETSRLEKSGLIFNDFNLLFEVFKQEDKDFDERKFLDSYYQWSLEVLNRFNKPGFSEEYLTVKSSIYRSFPQSYIFKKRLNSLLRGILGKLC